jgi:hypothetical protein
MITSGVDLMMRMVMKLLGKEDGRTAPAMMDAAPDKDDEEDGENDDCRRRAVVFWPKTRDYYSLCFWLVASDLVRLSVIRFIVPGVRSALFVVLWPNPWGLDDGCKLHIALLVLSE